MKKTGTAIMILFVVFLAFSTLFVACVGTTNDFWITKSSMPTGRLGPGVVAVNGLIYAIGGTNAGGANEEYNPATDTWITKASIPTLRTNFGIAVYQNKIYAIGGGGDFGNQEVTGANEVYDPATNTWETRTAMPTHREFMCANVVDGKIYVIGGSKPVNFNNISYVPNVNEVYCPETDTWASKTPPPFKVSNYASAVVDNKIYIISGIAGNGDYNDLILIYDPEKDTWSNGTSIPTPVWGAAAGVTSGELAPKRLYVIGGYPAFNKVQIYDLNTDSWTAGAQMPTNRYGLGVAVVNDLLYALGGPGSPAIFKNEMYVPMDHKTGVPVFSPTPSVSSTPSTAPSPTVDETNPLILAVCAILLTFSAIALMVKNSKKTNNFKQHGLSVKKC